MSSFGARIRNTRSQNIKQKVINGYDLITYLLYDTNTNTSTNTSTDTNNGRIQLRPLKQTLIQDAYFFLGGGGGGGTTH